MATNDIPKEFFDVADEFIRLANELSGRWPSSRISSAMMYATARYNACNYYHSHDTNAGNAVDYLCQEYRTMLLENMEILKSRSKS